MTPEHKQVANYLEPQTHAELAEMTAEALIDRGEKLLRVGRELLSQASHTAALTALPEERSVGRKGVVAEPEAIAAAKELRVFSRRQFADALGLSASGVSRWLAKLIEREHPVIERTSDGYAYIEPVATVHARRRETPAEAELIDRNLAPKRGEAVRVPAVQRHKQELSRSGSGHRIKRKDAEYERNQAIRAERAGRRQRNGSGPNGNGNGKT